MVDMKTPYYEEYKLIPEDYSLIKIEDLNFSNRLRNRLLAINVLYVADLLRLSGEDLRKIQGLGKNCFDEVERYCRELKKEKNANNADKIAITRELFPYIENIKSGDFSFALGLDICESSKKYLDLVKESHLIIEQELIDECLDGTKEVYEILNALEDFTKYVDARRSKEKVIDSFTADRISTSLKWLLFAYTDDEATRTSLLEGINNQSISLKDYIGLNEEKLVKNEPVFKSFVKWCNFNVQTEISEFFTQFFDDTRANTVITMRSAGCTLEQVGKELEVTRERVRQLEKKISTKFLKWQNRKRIIFKIFTDAKEEVTLSANEICELAGAFGEQFTYFLKINEFDNVSYDKQLDMFIIEDGTLIERVQTYIDNLPDAFTEAKAKEYIIEGEENFGYPSKMLEAVLEENYNKTGVTYHRSRLTLEKLYPEVIKRFYPDGMHIYDESELFRFREIVKHEYGIELNQVNRAISAIIARTCILCGRGIYKAKEKSYISKALAKKIFDYIENSEYPVFMTNMIYSIFEEELLAENIDNKYYLQGILHELYGDKWFFRRDYIAKDDSVTSMYAGIIGYIKKSMYPVKKQELYDAFPGVTEIVFTLATSDKSILNLFGEYIHVSHLKLSEGDVQYLHGLLKKQLEMREVCNCRDIYEYVNNDNPTLLKNNHIKYAFCMYSLLEYLFGENYNFSRPFVAKLDVKIDRIYDVLTEMIRGTEEIEVSEISSFAREYHFQIASILDFIDSCNDTHLLISKEKVMRIERTGITREIAIQIENLIYNEIQDTQPIVQLKCLLNLPKVNVQWNEWLIYSVLKKWSDKLEVSPSFHQFRHSTPLVAPIGKLTKIDVGDIGTDGIGSMVVADDLSNIDSLIEDYVFDDLDLEDF